MSKFRVINFPNVTLYVVLSPTQLIKQNVTQVEGKYVAQGGISRGISGKKFENFRLNTFK